MVPMGKRILMAVRWKVEIRYWDIGILGYWDIGILGYWDNGILGMYQE